MINVLYIYGYGSSANNNRTVNNLKKLLPSNYNVMCYSYNQDDCVQARNKIKKIIKDKDISLLIGSSLGGFIALTIPNIPKIVCNPCWSPSEVLPTIGCDKDIADTYKPFESNLTDCDMDEEYYTLGFFSTDDELLGTKYQDVFKKNYGNPIIIKGMGHRLTEDGIKNYIVPNLDKLWNKVRKINKFITNESKLEVYDDIVNGSN